MKYLRHRLQDTFVGGCHLTDGLWIEVLSFASSRTQSSNGHSPTGPTISDRFVGPYSLTEPSPKKLHGETGRILQQIRARCAGMRDLDLNVLSCLMERSPSTTLV